MVVSGIASRMVPGMKNPAVVLLGTALIFALGWMLGRRSAPVVVKPPLEAAAVAGPVDVVPATAEPVQSELPTQIATAAETAVEPELLSADDLWSRVLSLQGLEELRFATLVKAGRRDVDIPRMLVSGSFSGRGDEQLSDEFCEVFELSAEERRHLDEALVAAKQSIATLEVPNAASSLSADGTELLITVEPFPVEGGRVYDRLRQVFGRVLGSERNAVFEEAYAGTFDDLFNGMGTRRRELTVKLVPKATGGGGQKFYGLTDASVSGLGRSYGQSVLRWDDLRARLGRLAAMLPASEPDVEVPAPTPDPGGP